MKYYTDGKRHLICYPYSIENLHLMAKNLDLPKHWFHKGKYPHYDIPKNKMKEIEDKCEIISPKIIVRIIKEHQEFIECSKTLVGCNFKLDLNLKLP